MLIEKPRRQLLAKLHAQEAEIGRLRNKGIGFLGRRLARDVAKKKKTIKK
jgi:hypothetical protein